MLARTLNQALTDCAVSAVVVKSITLNIKGANSNSTKLKFALDLKFALYELINGLRNLHFTAANDLQLIENTLQQVSSIVEATKKMIKSKSMFFCPSEILYKNIIFQCKIIQELLQQSMTHVISTDLIRFKKHLGDLMLNGRWLDVKAIIALADAFNYAPKEAQEKMQACLKVLIGEIQDTESVSKFYLENTAMLNQLIQALDEDEEHRLPYHGMGIFQRAAMPPETSVRSSLQMQQDTAALVSSSSLAAK